MVMVKKEKVQADEGDDDNYDGGDDDEDNDDADDYGDDADTDDDDNDDDHHDVRKYMPYRIIATANPRSLFNRDCNHRSDRDCAASLCCTTT